MITTKPTRITYQVEALNELNEWVHWDKRETPHREVALKNLRYHAEQPNAPKEFRLVKVETVITKTVDIEYHPLTLKF